MISDVHLGKVNHFRKSGIPIPTKIADHDLNTMATLAEKMNTRRLIVLGDLFHSVHNLAWDQFCTWRHKHPELEIELVKGNHDILQPMHYAQGCIRIHDQSLNLGPFRLIHHPPSEIEQGVYTIAGHLHPGVRLVGDGQPSLRLPCFYFGKHHAVLPAFSQFTGLAILRPKKGDFVAVISGDEVIPVT